MAKSWTRSARPEQGDLFPPPGGIDNFLVAWTKDDVQEVAKIELGHELTDDDMQKFIDNFRSDRPVEAISNATVELLHELFGGRP